MNPLSSADTEAPPQQDAPSDERRDAVVAQLRDAIGDALVAVHLVPGQDLWVRVATSSWAETGQAARDVLGLRYFCFLSAIDWLPSPFGRSMDSAVDSRLGGSGFAAAEEEAPAEMTWGVTGGESRFQVFARLMRPSDALGVTFKVDVPDDTMTLDSWTTLYGGANWHEREAWEMFGITFAGHPGLRSLYLPTGFEGNPLRKDFPLVARMVKAWPGIVDVEAMPGEEADGGDDA